MKVIMVAVVSANGKLTRSIGSGQARGNESNIYSWTSKEDQDFFFSLISKNKLIVMGSGTYRAVRDKLKVESSRLRVVMTRRPKEYKNERVAEALEFSSETPRELVRRLSKNYKKMLLVGGSQVYSSFMKEGLVDEIYLTVEPVFFGMGKNLVAKGEFETRLELVSIEKLNKKGTLLLKYKVEK